MKMKWVKGPLEMRQPLLLGAGGAVALALLVRVLLMPAVRFIHEQRATLEALRVKVADAQLLRDQLATEDAALRAMRARYQILERKIGEGQSVARILEALREQAAAHRLTFAATQSRTEEPDERLVSLGPGVTLREVPLTLQLTGRYQQLAEFLGGLSEVSLLASVQKLTITKPQPDSSTLNADVVLSVYLAHHNSIR